MALPDTIVLNGTSSTGTNFDLINRSNLQSLRLDRTTNLIEPREMVISHSSSTDKKSGIITDRHLVSFRKTLTTSKGEKVQAQVNLTIPIPRDVIVTDAVVRDLVGFLADFLFDGVVAAGLPTQAYVDDIRKNIS